MKVRIENERIVIGDKSLEYYSYYFGIWDRENDHRLVVKKVLDQWASALTDLKGSTQPVYLPYYLDDEGCEALEAKQQGDDILLTVVLTTDDGWAFDLDDLHDYIHTVPDIYERKPDIFGHYKLDELIDGLRNAETAV